MSDDFLAHIGVLRRSGRYPWGSGKNPHQRNRMFIDVVAEEQRRGLSDKDIVEKYGLDSTTQLRALRSIAKNEQRQARVTQAIRLQKAGMSNVAIGIEMGIPESSVRSLLNPTLQERNNILANTASMLRESVHKSKYVDVGSGVEVHLGISKEKLATAVEMLKEEGYAVINVQTPQLTGSSSQKTIVKVLAPPGTTYKDVVTDTGSIRQLRQVSSYSEDGGRSFRTIDPPTSISSKRLAIRYKEQGGDQADGVIYVRPGVPDVSLGGARYVQTRIMVDGTHYIKGMAMYRDDLPDGVDLMFNTPKSDTGNKLDALKPIKDDPDLPFGSIVRQMRYTDSKGRERVSVINIVNDENDWDDWSRNLASQMLSKQRPELARQQLDMTYANRKAQFDRIMSLTNPAVKQKMLEEFADSADSAAVHLKAAALPGQKTHVILPFSSIRETEIYAPNYNNGDRVVLVRYPHGGIFEIPELTVNNRNLTAKKVLGNARAAVGINPKVAARLSGADFDGDTVLVIPNKPAGPGRIQTKDALDGLRGFDPSEVYKGYEGMKVMSNTQQEMGKISNLITDMTIKRASDSEIARAVRHSMVVIDAEKKGLNYKQSEKDNGIAELRLKYQGPVGQQGASTLISRASAEVRVPQRKQPSGRRGIDPETGEKVYIETGAGYVRRTVNKRTGEVTEKFIPKQQQSTQMAEARDAHKLSSGTVMETIYADHANRLKALANTARKETLNIKSTPYSPSAKAAYASEVASLSRKLMAAQKNAPLERQAQLLGNSIVSAKQRANPGMTASELKKIRARALMDAREVLNARKQRIDITDEEWNAIQAGAITNNRLVEILRHADPARVQELALPRTNTVMNKAMMTRALSMQASGYTQAEIAEQLGVPASTLNDALARES